MSEPTFAIDRNMHELSMAVAGMLGRLAAPDRTASPTKYQGLMREVSAIRDMWLDHLQMESRLFPAIPLYDRHMERDRAKIRQQLDALNSAGWPRSIQTGLNSLNLRATETLTLLLHQLEKERTALLPVLRRRLALEPKRSEHVTARLGFSV